MKCLIYLTIFVATNCYANCRVANDEIVCDNSNTLIDMYNSIVPKTQNVQRVIIINQQNNYQPIQSNSNSFDIELLNNEKENIKHEAIRFNKFK